MMSPPEECAHGTAPHLAADLHAAIGDLLRGWSAGTAPAVIAAWIEFAAGGCDEARLRTALEVAGEAVGRQHPNPPDASPAPAAHLTSDSLDWPSGLRRIYPPERVACLAAKRQGRAAPPWAQEAVRAAWPADAPLETVIRWANRAADRMLTCSSPVLDPASADSLDGVGDYRGSRSPASMLRCTAWAAECVEALETARVVAGHVEGETPAHVSVEAFSEGDVVPLSQGAGNGDERPGHRSRMAWVDLTLRLDVVSQWWLSRPRLDQKDDSAWRPGITRAMGVIRAVLRRVADPHYVDDGGTGVTVGVEIADAAIGDSAAAWTSSVTVGSDALMRVLTGTVAVGAPDPPPDTVLVSAVRTPPPGDASALRPFRVFVVATARRSDPRSRFLRDGLMVVEPKLLSAQGVPLSSSIAQLDEQSAIVTGHESTSSLRIFGDGRVEPLSPWPRPIRGEVPWGPDGSHVAWTTHGAGDWVMVRASDGAITAEVQAPCPVLRVFPQAGGDALVAGSLGGLWNWRPGGTFAQVAPTAPILWLEPCGTDIRLDHYHRGASNAVVRRVEPVATRWNPERLEADPIVLDERGAVASRSSRGGWTATAYPGADLIELTHDDGRMISLACYYPRDVAWAGESLLVGPWDGERLFFRNFVAVLEGRA